ncbi:hypothetical protein ACOMHN_054182 [Nucella lapillus]
MEGENMTMEGEHDNGRWNTTMEGGNTTMEGGNMTMEGEHDNGRWNTTMEGGNTTMEGGNTTMEGGNTTMEGGNTTMEGGNMTMEALGTANCVVKAGEAIHCGSKGIFPPASSPNSASRGYFPQPAALTAHQGDIYPSQQP